MTPRPKALGKWTRRNIIIDDALWQRIKDRAKSEDRTPSALIRVVVKEYLTRRE